MCEQVECFYLPVTQMALEEGHHARHLPSSTSWIASPKDSRKVSILGRLLTRLPRFVGLQIYVVARCLVSVIEL